ncbi:hypothetical protein CIT25_30360 [Mesorhizobium mediterraneum]|uniref:Uncharacterized protein n=1 Tax=Mesorhizobium mediterraneum TaxID=43617 RepID=A0AB36R1G4_9HYPH|nr:hypothetical protein CIT25_30360 [Mesorhizobium mediterraneum]
MIWSKIFFGITQARTAFRRVASKGVYAGGGSIAEGGAGCKPLGVGSISPEFSAVRGPRLCDREQYDRNEQE